MQTQIMAPGILVALKTSVRGGVQYQRTDLDEADDGTFRRWQTTRLMEDPEERRTAGETAGKAARLVSKLCIRTSFGLLCPADREEELDEAVVQMRATAAEWNRKAKHSYVYVSAIKGRIADNDEEAVRAILSEAQELLEQMDKGIAEADVKVIRDAANRAKRLAEMMTPDTGDQIAAAVASARQAAKAIVKRGEDIADKVQNAVIEVQREQFDEARFSFLDTAQEVAESLPAVNLQRGADLEIEVA